MDKATKNKTESHSLPTDYVPPKRSLIGKLAVSFGASLTKRRALWEIAGQENIPCDVPFVIVANHVTFIDALWIFASLPAAVYAKTCAMIGADLKTDYGILGKLMTSAARAIPVERNSSRMAAARSIIIAKNTLEAGNNVLIHPEGTRSPDGKLGTFKNGASYLGYKYGAPILPVYIEGGYKIWPKGQRLPSFKDPQTGEKNQLKITFYPCIHGQDYHNVNDLNQALEAFFRELEAART